MRSDAAAPPAPPGPADPGRPDGADPPPAARGRTGRRLAWLAAALAAAWLVPLLAHLVRLDVAVPVLLWLATAALLRGGTTLVDRLVLAFAALVAAVCVAGLVFAVWPAHLAPVPATGTALTGLVVIGAVTGRVPRPPRPAFAWRDAPVVLVGVLAAVIAWAPVAGRDTTGRLAVVLSGEDLSRHFMIFDWMGRVGGYLFQSPAVHGRLADGFLRYPQGSHLVAAVLERFRHPGGPVGTATSLSDYVDYTLGGYVFLAVALAWAVSWVWAGRLRPAWGVLVYLVLAVVLCFSQQLSLITRGYPSQMTGLALLALVVALAARPLGAAPGTGREQVTLLAALLVALGFVYYFYVPVGLLAVAGWAWQRRAALRAHRTGFALAALVTAGLAGLVPVLNLTHGGLSVLTYGGPAVYPPARWLAVLSVAGAAVLVGPGALRRASVRTDPVRGLLALVFAGTVLFVAGLVMARLALGDGVMYYVKKALYALVTVDLVLLGGLGAAVRPWLDRPRAARLAARVPRWAAPVMVAVAALALLGGTRVADPRPAHGSLIFLPVPAAGANYGRAYAAGALALPEQAAAAVQAADQAAAGGRLVLFWNAYGRGYDFYTAQWANVLDRRLDDPMMAAMVQIPRARTGGELERLLSSLGPGPVLVVTREDATAAEVAAYRAAHPGRDIAVLRLPGDCGDRCRK